MDKVRHSTMHDWTAQHKKGDSVMRFANKEKEMTQTRITRGRGSHNILTRVPQRLQLFSVIAAVVGGGGGGVLFCGANIACVGVSWCVCVVLDRRNHFNQDRLQRKFCFAFSVERFMIPVELHLVCR